MSQRQCDKCGEMVDEARAFCPGCGHALVEEKKRSTTSEFESLDHTQQMGQTMYNRMLSDMGLNISNRPKAPQQQAANVTAVRPAATTPRQNNERIATAAAPSSAPSSGYLKWIVIAAAAILVLALVVVVVAAFVVWFLGRS